MPLELRELIIQARIDSSGSAEHHEPDQRLTTEALQEIFEAVMERVEERLAAAQQR
ncbi:MAG: DUF5908 family protein [Verrucomicrobia bacterium]|nr:DUF5908 family protein [Verrucomicrobiota bacterium]